MARSSAIEMRSAPASRRFSFSSLQNRLSNAGSISSSDKGARCSTAAAPRLAVRPCDSGDEADDLLCDVLADQVAPGAEHHLQRLVAGHPLEVHAVGERGDLVPEIVEVGEEILAQADDDAKDVLAEDVCLGGLGRRIETSLDRRRRAPLDQIAQLVQQRARARRALGGAACRA